MDSASLSLVMLNCVIRNLVMLNLSSWVIRNAELSEADSSDPRNLQCWILSCKESEMLNRVIRNLVMRGICNAESCHARDPKCEIGDAESCHARTPKCEIDAESCHPKSTILNLVMRGIQDAEFCNPRGISRRHGLRQYLILYQKLIPYQKLIHPNP
jgi:hypothetical protein